MKLIEKVFEVIIILLLLSLFFPETGFSWQRSVYAEANISKSVTKHAPEFITSPEIDMLTKTKQPKAKLGKKKANKWLWIGLGVLAAGVLAGAGGGGGGDGGSGGGGGGDDTGSIVISGPAP